MAFILLGVIVLWPVVYLFALGYSWLEDTVLEKIESYRDKRRA